MFSSPFKTFLLGIFIILLFILFFSIFIPVLIPEYKYKLNSIYDYSTIIGNGTFPWPTPGYTIITSAFGSRSAPTSGASTFHSGVDIGAPTGANIIAVCSGKVTFLGFNGAGGFTIIIENNTFSASYCHVSPEFQVFLGQSIKQGQIIGKVGPEYIYGVPENPYTDENGNPTNGATTGPHLHLTLRKNGELINPLDYIT